MGQCADLSCFVSYELLGSRPKLSWLKPYFIFFDEVYFETRYMWKLQRNAHEVLDTSEAAAMDLLVPHARFVEDLDLDFVDQDGRSVGVEGISERVAPTFATRVAVTKRRLLHQGFYRSWRSRMSLRGAGWGDKNPRYDVVARNQTVGDRNLLAYVLRDVSDEVAGLLLADVLEQLYGLYPVLDRLSAWVASRVLAQSARRRNGFIVFERILSRCVPDFAELPWQAVVDLRGSRYRRALQQQMMAFGRDGATGGEVSALEDALWELVGIVEGSARVGRAALGGLVANIPMPYLLPNPLSVAQGIIQVTEARRRRSKFGWLFFVREIRERRTSRA